MEMRPEVGRSRLAISRSSTVLPEPLAPAMPKAVLGATVNEISCKTTRPPKRRTTCSTTTAGSAGGRGIGGRSSCSTVSRIVMGEPQTMGRSSDGPDGGDIQPIQADLANGGRERGIERVSQANLARRGDVPLAVGHDATTGADLPGLPFGGAPVEQRYREGQVGLAHTALNYALDVQAQLAQLERALAGRNHELQGDRLAGRDGVVVAIGRCARADAQVAPVHRRGRYFTLEADRQLRL